MRFRSSLLLAGMLSASLISTENLTRVDVEKARANVEKARSSVEKAAAVYSGASKLTVQSVDRLPDCELSP